MSLVAAVVRTAATNCINTNNTPNISPRTFPTFAHHLQLFELLAAFNGIKIAKITTRITHSLLYELKINRKKVQCDDSAPQY